MEVEIRESQQITVAAMRHKGPYSEIGDKLRVLEEWAKGSESVDETAQYIAIYYDNPSWNLESRLRSDACLVCDENFQGDPDAGVESLTVGGGEEVIAVHKGSDEKLAKAYEWLIFSWMIQNKVYPSGGAIYNIFLNNPDEVEEAELLTEIHVPLGRMQCGIL